jgi:hypothetical protein
MRFKRSKAAASSGSRATQTPTFHVLALAEDMDAFGMSGLHLYRRKHA